MDKYQRASNYVAKMEPSIAGSGGHTAAYRVARALCSDFELTPEEALPIMQSWNDGCQPPWSEKEMMSKLKKAYNTPKNPNKDKSKAQEKKIITKDGIEITTDPPKYTKNSYETIKQPELNESIVRILAEKARNIFTSNFLTNISPIDPTSVTSHEYLSYLFNTTIGEKTIIFSKKMSQGQCLWPDESHKIPKESTEGVVFMANPVDGKYRQRDKNEKPSRRNASCLLSYKYILVESDVKELLKDWITAMITLPLPIVSITTSGNKSIHILLKCNCSSKKEWETHVAKLTPALAVLGCDTQAIKNPVIMPRLPGAYRIIDGKKKLQKLLYFNPYPSIRPLMNAPILRDYPDDLKNLAKTIIRMDPSDRDPRQIQKLINQLNHLNLPNWANDLQKLTAK